MPHPHQFGPYSYPPGSQSTPTSHLHPSTATNPSNATSAPASVAENRSPAHSSGSASPYHSAAQGARTPQSYGSNDEDQPRAGSGSNSGEFSGLVSYFSSQHDDLNT